MGRKMSDNETYRKLQEYFSSVEFSPKLKKTYCQYIDKSSDRYCIATTCKECNRCRHFTPTTMGKMELLVLHFGRMDREIDNLKSKIDKKDEDIKELKHTIMSYELELDVMSARLMDMRNEAKKYEEEYKKRQSELQNTESSEDEGQHNNS